MIGNHPLPRDGVIEGGVMDLSRPLAVLTPTLDGDVLAALAGTDGWAAGRQVQRLVQASTGAGSVEGVRRVLLRLVEQGIVLADEQPHATLYRLNHDHVAADTLLALTRVRGTLVERLATAVTSWPEPALHAGLFGPFARAAAGPLDDIDILVVFPPDAFRAGGEPAAQVDRLAADVLRWTGNHAHIVTPTSDALESMIESEDPLLELWSTAHVHLAGARWPDLLRNLGVLSPDAHGSPSAPGSPGVAAPSPPPGARPGGRGRLADL